MWTDLYYLGADDDKADSDYKSSQKRKKAKQAEKVQGPKKVLPPPLKKFKLDTKRNFFQGRVVKRWKVLPEGVVASPSLAVFERRVDMAVRDIV